MVNVRSAITIIQPEPGTVKSTEFPVATACWLGIAQLVIGILCFIFHIVMLVIDAGADRGGHGMWGGAAFIITGSVAIWTAYKPDQYWIAGLLAASIMSFFLALLVFIIAAIGLSTDSGWNDCDHFGDCRDPVSDSKWRSRLAMNSLLLILALIEVPVALWSSLICGQVHIVLATTTVELSEAPHQNTEYNHYTEPPIGRSTHAQNPLPPERSTSSRDVSRQLAVAHGYNQQTIRNPGYSEPPPGSPDYNSNRRAPLPPTTARPVSQASTLPRSSGGYMYDNMAADLLPAEYRGSYKHREATDPMGTM